MADVDPSDRKAYLEEQMRRKERGEPVDVEWVAEELQRVRREQMARLQASQRNLRWIVIGGAVLMFIMWVRSGGGLDRRSLVALGLIVIGLFVAFALRGNRSRPGPPSR